MSPGRGPAPTAPCGSVSAYKRHLRNDETVDDACRAAWNEYHRDRWATKKAKAKKPARKRSR